MEQLQFAAILEKIETLKDGSIKIIIETQELTSKDAAKLFGYRNGVGYITFTPNPEETIVVPREQAEVSTKTPAVRMRNVLYRLWEQKGKPTDTYEEYYKIQMEKMISALKEKLE